MKRKLYHPLWVHLPAVGMIVWVVVEWVRCLPLPTTIPIHFDASGQPDTWEWPAAKMLGIIHWLAYYLGLGVLTDEIWARSENVRRFNWLTCFDDALIGWTAVSTVAFLNAAKSQSATPPIDWHLGAGLAAVCSIAALLLESRRQFVPKIPDEAASFEAPVELIERMKSKSAWTYWESQNPWWMSLVAVGVGVYMLAEAGVLILSTHTLFPGAGRAIIGVACFALYGGFRVTVTRETITLRLGLFGIRLMRLPLAEIGSAETREFFPLKDFGGYGIRFNREMSGYFLRGNVGVLITDIRGKKTLIGSDNPERLVAVIEAAKDSV